MPQEGHQGVALNLAAAHEQLNLFVSNGTLDSVDSALDLRYGKANGHETKSARAKRQARNPLDPAADDRPGGPQRLPTSPQDMLTWAQQNGWLINLDDLEARIGLST